MRFLYRCVCARLYLSIFRSPTSLLSRSSSLVYDLIGWMHDSLSTSISWAKSRDRHIPLLVELGACVFTQFIQFFFFFFKYSSCHCYLFTRMPTLVMKTPGYSATSHFRIAIAYSYYEPLFDAKVHMGLMLLLVTRQLRIAEFFISFIFFIFYFFSWDPWAAGFLRILSLLKHIHYPQNV